MNHGLRVERARSYLPGFFDRAPRNIALKISSGYKAVEWHTYLYNYAVSMLRHRLPHDIWRNFCRYVKSVRILCQEKILHEEIFDCKVTLNEATVEFETLYYARDPDLLHVVRPCIHTILHGPDEILLRGSLICCTQMTMERLIGDLGAEIRQPSKPYANLSQRALRRCQVNAIKAMLPSLDRSASTSAHGVHTRHGQARLPRGALDLGDGYYLLRALQSKHDVVPRREAVAFYDYLATHHPHTLDDTDRATYHQTLKIRKWARLRLPVNQVTRSAWKEHEKPLSQLRMARCIKVRVLLKFACM